MKGINKASSSFPESLRYVQTGSVFGALFTLGLVSAVIGPTLNDLKSIFNESVESTVQILAFKGFGVFAGSLLSSSFLYRYFNGKLCIVAAMLIGGVSHAIIPIVPSLKYAAACTLVGGMCVGTLETGGNVWLVQLWKDKVAPVFQMYHLSFGIGALLSPVIAEPFLHSEKLAANSSVPELVAESRISIPYALFGSLYAVVGVFMLVLYFVDSTDLAQHSPTEHEKPAKNATLFDLKIVTHLILYILVLVAIENTIFQMLSVYVVQNEALHFDEHWASYLVADYWALFTVGRAVAIYLAFKLAPYTILVFSNTVCITGTFILLIFGTTQAWSLWVAVGILGFGLAPCYGAAMSWAVSYVKLKYVHMTLVLVASCTGQMTPPLAVGWWVAETPAIFVYVITGLMVVHTINLSFMYLSIKVKPAKPVAEPPPPIDILDIREI